MNRSEEKNALAISSSNQRPIDSYNQVKENYNKSLKNDDLKKCPDFGEVIHLLHYYFEFWEGHESRLNKREAYEKSDDSWEHSYSSALGKILLRNRLISIKSHHKMINIKPSQINNIIFNT